MIGHEYKSLHALFRILYPGVPHSLRRALRPKKVRLVLVWVASPVQRGAARGFEG